MGNQFTIAIEVSIADGICTAIARANDTDCHTLLCAGSRVKERLPAIFGVIYTGFASGGLPHNCTRDDIYATFKAASESGYEPIGSSRYFSRVQIGLDASYRSVHLGKIIFASAVDVL